MQSRTTKSLNEQDPIEKNAKFERPNWGITWKKERKLTRFAKPSFIVIVVGGVIEGQEVNKLGCIEVFVEFINSEVPF